MLQVMGNPEEFVTSTELSHEELKKVDLNNIKLPYVIKGKILMSPGVWNGKYYDFSAIKSALENTNFTKEVTSLFYDHDDDKAKTWVGEVKNIRLEGTNIVGDLHIVDMDLARKLAYGARFGISPRLLADEYNNEIKSFQFENFSVVLNPAVKTAYINNSQQLVEEDVEQPKEVLKMNKEEIRQLVAELVEDELKKKKKEYPYPKAYKQYPDPYESGADKELNEEELLSAYTEFIKKFLKENPGKTIADAAKAWKKKKKMSEAELQDEEQKEEQSNEAQEQNQEQQQEQSNEPEQKQEEQVSSEQQTESLNEAKEELQKVKEELSEIKKKLEEEPDRKSQKSIELRESIEKLSEHDKNMLFWKYLQSQKPITR